MCWCEGDVWLLAPQVKHGLLLPVRRAAQLSVSLRSSSCNQHRTVTRCLSQAGITAVELTGNFSVTLEGNIGVIEFGFIG